MFTLGYSFRPWPGEKSIADGTRHPRVHPRHRGRGRHRREDPLPPPHRRRRLVDRRGRWHVTAERTDTGERVELTAGFLFSCSGYYRYDHGYLPDFAGMDRFGGTIVHPQPWPEDLDFAGKRVVVIGSGATAVTLVPSIADTAGHVTMLQRSPTYIASLPADEPAGPACCGGSCPTGGRARRPLDQRAHHPGLYQLSRRRPERREAGAAQGRRAPAARGLRRRHPLHPALRPVGPAAVRGPRRRPVHGHPRRHGVGRHRPHRDVHRDRHPAEVGRRARGRHRRHRHRARAAVPRRHRAVASTARRSTSPSASPTRA